MKKQPLVTDRLWTFIAPLLPPHPPKPKGGRPRVPDRAALTGILFVLKSGIPWEMLPLELSCGSGVTCWRRLRDWRHAGVGWRSTRCCSTTSGVLTTSTGHGPAWTARVSRPKGGAATGPNPTDRGKPGTKRHVVVERQGIPLAIRVTGANRHDSTVFEEMIDAIPPIKHPWGRPRKRPDKLHADKAYDHRRCRQALHRRKIKVRIARHGVDSSERLGRHRWVVERTLAWVSRFRRLTIRYERRHDIHEAFLHLGCALICLNSIERF